jgi:hypothetical protein
MYDRLGKLLRTWNNYWSIIILVKREKERREADGGSGWWWKVVKKRKKRSRRLDNHSFSGLSGLEAPKGGKSLERQQLNEL